jgi:translation elongation factor EF-Tu-like GTPase
MISDELKSMCEKNLTTENYITISKETGLSVGYIKDIRGQIRYNSEVELLFKSELKKVLSEKLEMFEKIDSL